MALVAAGALLVVRPVIHAAHPFKTGAAGLVAALTLGLAAGSLGMGPGDTPRDGFLDPGYLREHGGLLGESLLWASSHLFSEAGSREATRSPAYPNTTTSTRRRSTCKGSTPRR